jgi:hypothetical protein
VNTDQEYDAQQPQSMLEDLDPDDMAGPRRSPVLHGTYPPQFDHAHYQQAHAMQSGQQQQQMVNQGQFEQPPLSQPPQMPGAAGGAYGPDPGDSALGSDPFGMSASM